jgi:RimJ/RimL family protein N-acetyltransferase
VDRYGVAPSHAGSGIGKRLLRAWLRWAKNGFAWTYTVADNARSINALINVGFRAWDTDVLPGGKPRDYKYCLWRKPLKS